MVGVSSDAPKFTVFDITGQCGRSAPHTQPCNLHYRSLPPSSGDSAKLPAGSRIHLRKHSIPPPHRHPNTLPECRSRTDSPGGDKSVDVSFDVPHGGLGSVICATSPRRARSTPAVLHGARG